MCGRYTSRFSDTRKLPPELASLVQPFAPRYNIAPQQTAPVIRVVEGAPVFEELRWGFRPSWLKDKNKAQINARAETVFSKPMFKHSALNRRCLVLASGWYEWQVTPHGKQPFAFHLENDPMFAFAGIWTTWHADGEESEDVDSYAIVTTDASTTAAPIHNRMPVVLDAMDCTTWLDGEKDADQLTKLLTPYLGKDLDAYPVSTKVNSPRNTGPECLEPLATSP